MTESLFHGIFFWYPKKNWVVFHPRKNNPKQPRLFSLLICSTPSTHRGGLWVSGTGTIFLCQVKVSPLAEWQLPSRKLTYIAPEIGRASSWLPRHQQKKCHCRACSWQVQAFVQLLVKRKCRSKPLLELKCLGCSSTTFDRCRFIPCDVLEWAPGYYRLTRWAPYQL